MAPPIPKPNIAPTDPDRWSIGLQAKRWLFGWFRHIRADTIGDENASVPIANVIASATQAHSHDNKTELDKVTIGDHDVQTDNPHGVTKEQLGLENVTNDAQVKRSEMGQALGVPTLDALGLVPAYQLPAATVGIEDKLQMEIAWKSAYQAYYSEFIYSGTALTEINLYDGPGKGTHLFQKTFGYTGTALTSSTLTRISDGRVLTKALSYTGTSLTGITRTLT